MAKSNIQVKANSSLLQFVQTAGLLLISCALIALAIYALIISTIAIDSYRMHSVFDHDAAHAVRMVMANIHENAIDPHGFFYYGYFLHSLAFLVLKGLALVTQPIEYLHAAFVLKGVVALSLVFSLVVFFRILRCFETPTLPSLLLASFFTLTPALFYWGFHIHPDILQVPLIGFAILSILTPKNLKILSPYFQSGFFLGLAIATKISAIFVIPFFVIFELMRESQIPFVRRVIIGAFTALFSFFTINSSVLSNPSGFLAALRYEKEHVARGHQQAESTNPLLWIDLLVGEFGIFFSVAFACFVLFTALALVRKKFPRTTKNAAFVAALLTFMLALGYLMYSVNMRRARYVLQLYPLVVVVTGASLACLQSFSSQHVKKCASYGMSLSCFILFLWAYNQRLQDIASWKDRYTNSQAIEAGRYLSQIAQQDDFILAGQYSYVPEKFTNTTITYQFKKKELENADYLILNSSVPGRHLWPKSLSFSEFKRGQFDISQEQSVLLAPVFKGEFGELVWKSSEILIYKNLQHHAGK